ncbi:MAG TPA: molybdopterin-binding protein [Methanocella sp.]|uniref:competence/damage-inducible protein A n=1 Tax=Methanocella sp. TaxID=2052833 RepID=UPI002BAD45DA|nr:molybdopterin-binding protein [Methanocella sp.]HTY91365.1 molybdopterin-binding protein [Methanocella sp.]
MDAVIVCIGDELLSGDIADLNSTWLAKNLTELGTLVKRIEVIPDDIAVIVQALKDIEADKVIVTGGLGPTHDDVTRVAVASAFNRRLIRDPEAVKVVEASAARHNRKPLPQSYNMADIPDNVVVIPNPVGAAPGFIVDGRVYAFPGVPSEMKAMFELVKDHFHGPKLMVDWIITEKPESAIVADLNEAVKRFPRVIFGSYPSDVVRIKMKSYDGGELQAAKEWLSKRVL